MLSETLGLDAKDTRLLSLCSTGNHSQAELAEKVGISQPSVNARIKRLKEKGLLATQSGVDVKKTKMVLARVDFTATHAEQLLQELSGCSFFVNGFILSGTKNVSLFVVARDLQKVESILDRHLRNHEGVKDLDMHVVVNTTNPFICSLDLEKEHHEACQKGSCDECELVKLQ